MVIDSSVVKVFDATMTSVVAGSSPRSVSARCAPSTFETKCTRGPSWSGDSARTAMAGPRSEPPMPMLMTSVKLPARTPSAKARTSARAPSTSSPGGATAPPRSAMWSAARPSVRLTGAPANIASRRPSTSAARASARSASSAAASSFSFEMSMLRSSKAKESRSNRAGSSANSVRRWIGRRRAASR